MTAIAVAQDTLRREVLATVTFRSWVAFVYLILFGSCLAFTAYVYLLQNVPASRVATYAYVNPVVAVLLGALILNEHVTIWIVAGMGIIFAALLMVGKR
jgi:drug/metabolite transporter (DMT)-like permease